MPGACRRAESIKDCGPASKSFILTFQAKIFTNFSKTEMRFVIKKEKISASYDTNGAENAVMPFEKDASDEFYRPLANLNRSPVEALHRDNSLPEPANADDHVTIAGLSSFFSDLANNFSRSRSKWTASKRSCRRTRRLPRATSQSARRGRWQSNERIGRAEPTFSFPPWPTQVSELVYQAPLTLASHFFPLFKSRSRSCVEVSVSLLQKRRR